MVDAVEGGAEIEETEQSDFLLVGGGVDVGQDAQTPLTKILRTLLVLPTFTAYNPTAIHVHSATRLQFVFGRAWKRVFFAEKMDDCESKTGPIKTTSCLDDFNIKFG